MKKTTIAILSLFMTMSFATMALAATTVTTETGGEDVAIANDTGPGAGPTLTFTPSPSTLMSITTDATNFTIIAASSKTTGGTSGNGIEYGIDSGEAAVYQMVQATAEKVTATDSATILPDTFEDKAGNGAPQS